MNENRKNWLYPEASGLYFPHDGFVMRALDGKQYDIEEECELLNEYHKGYNECRDDVLRLEKENEKLKEENQELKEEVQLLKEGMEAYENSIPYVCTCEQVRDIHSEMFDFKMKQNKFYKEHPSRCTVIIDGVRYE